MEDGWVTVKVALPMRIVPVRELPLEFVVTLKMTHPDPVSSVLVVIHGAVVVATHEQADPVVTNVLLAPASGGMFRVVGFNVKLQLLPACVTVNVRPAIVSVPVRSVETSVRSTRNDTEPALEPLAPPVITIQGALLVAVQLHPVVVDTKVEPVPPFAPVDSATGAIENVQLAAA